MILRDEIGCFRLLLRMLRFFTMRLCLRSAFNCLLVMVMVITSLSLVCYQGQWAIWDARAGVRESRVFRYACGAVEGFMQ